MEATRNVRVYCVSILLRCSEIREYVFTMWPHFPWILSAWEKAFKEGRSYFESGSPIDSSPRVLDRKIFEGQLLDDGSSRGTYVKGGDDTGNFKREGAASFVHSPRMTDELSEWVT